MTEETTETTDAPEPIETEAVDAKPEVEEELKPTTEVDGELESSTDKQEVEEKPKANSASKRIDELTRKRRDAERDRDYWRQQAMSKEPEKPVEKVEEPLKTLEDFEYDEPKYQAHLFEKAQEGAVEAAKRVLKEEQSQQTNTRKQASFEAKEKEFAKGVDDYLDVARSNELPISQVMADVVTEMDNGPELLYYLGKNPDLAYEITQLSPLSAARELGKIEAKIQSQPKKGETVSKAPVPAPTIKAGTPAISKSLDELEGHAYNQARRKYINSKR